MRPRDSSDSAPDWRFVPQGQTTLLIVWPGWGFDARILDRVAPRLPADLLVPATAHCQRPPPWVEWAAAGRRLAVLGWSLGARRALAHLHRVPGPRLLLGLRPSFDPTDLEAHRQGLADDPRGFMHDFYRRAFLGQREDWAWFQATLLEEYLDTLDPPRLIAELDELAEPVAIEQVAVPGIHLATGRRDRIAPAQDWADSLRPHEFPATGHVALLHDDCLAWIRDRLSAPHPSPPHPA